MSSVRILEDHVVNQIAAGEVVERPASVVKELVENALDAGATRIEVTLQGGGRTLVRVADDGCGMGRDDAMMCVERHATSKIRQAEDLKAVATLGFRGEALPSIASVSRFTLVTRSREADEGTRLVLDGGKLADVRPEGASPGTVVDVRNLFFNLPARRKFLRSAGTELAHCTEAVTRQALAHPQVVFGVSHEGRVLLRAAGSGRADRAAALLGEDGRALVPVAFEDGGISVDALVSPVGVHRSRPSGSMYLYVNGRFVADSLLRRAVNEAYRDLVPKGRSPVAVLNMALDPGSVDVNVHPTKIEVRFLEPSRVLDTVARGIRAGLERHGIHLPAGDVARHLPSLPRAETPRAYVPALPLVAAPGPLYRVEPRPAVPPPAMLRPAPAVPQPASAVLPRPPSAPSASERLLPVPRFRDLTVLGQVDRSYIVCEGGGELVIVDQHAAHERVRLHQLRSDRDAHLGEAQRLLAPILVDLPQGRAELLLEHGDALSALHLEVESMGPGRVAVTSTPPLLEKADLPALLKDVADALAEGQGEGAEPADLESHVLGTMACHSAVRANQSLTPYEMQSLLASLDEVDFEVCAHGRPVAIRLSSGELERRFHR